ncbi:hypothetical protein KY312_02725, partial [Candidatus Woesearchaeota archaeon]|nr:hypothetical protein [Candidatus Woesearchaeota archaeon]
NLKKASEIIEFKLSSLQELYEKASKYSSLDELQKSTREIGFLSLKINTAQITILDIDSLLGLSYSEQFEELSKTIKQKTAVMHEEELKTKNDIDEIKAVGKDVTNALNSLNQVNEKYAKSYEYIDQINDLNKFEIKPPKNRLLQTEIKSLEIQYESFRKTRNKLNQTVKKTLVKSEENLLDSIKNSNLYMDKQAIDDKKKEFEQLQHVFKRYSLTMNMDSCVLDKIRNEINESYKKHYQMLADFEREKLKAKEKDELIKKQKSELGSLSEALSRSQEALKKEVENSVSQKKVYETETSRLKKELEKAKSSQPYVFNLPKQPDSKTSSKNLWNYMENPPSSMLCYRLVDALEGKRCEGGWKNRLEYFNDVLEKAQPTKNKPELEFLESVADGIENSARHDVLAYEINKAGLRRELVTDALNTLNNYISSSKTKSAA